MPITNENYGAGISYVPNAPQQPQADPGRSLNLAASDPISFAGQFGSAPANSDATQKFGSALTQMLQKYQQMGTHAAAQVQQGQLNYSDAGINAQNTQLTNPSLQGYNPGTIETAGATASKPFETASKGLGQVGQTFNEQLGNFGNILNNAQSFLQQQQAAAEKSKGDAQNIIHDAMSIGGDALSNLLQAQPDLVKAAGYDTKTLEGFVNNIKAKEAEAKKQFYYQHSNTSNTGGPGGGPGGTYVPGDDLITDSWITAVKNGNATMAQVPAAYKNKVAVGLNQGTSTVIVDPQTDARVKAIIAANPDSGKAGGKGYGSAADAINAISSGLADKYNAQLRAHYLDKQPVASAFNTDTTYSPLAGSRFALEATRISKPFTDLPAYQLVAGGVPYVSRIMAASQNPGSVSDQELLDAFTKLSTSGNAITDAQIKTVTGGKSYADTVNTFQNKFKNGGVLSDNQRKQIIDIAQKTLQAYQKDYQPIYNKVTQQLTASGVPKNFWTIPDLNTLAAGGSQSSSGSSSGGDYAAYRKAIGQ